MSKFTLPNGLTLEGKTYKLIELDEIRGKHQNMLVNPNPKTPIDHVEPLIFDLLIDLTTSEGESALDHISKKELILNKLPVQDIQFIMIKIREVSYGKDYIMNLECNHCGHKNTAKLDLSTLEVFPRKDKINESEMVLPKENIKFSYRHLSLSNLLKMAVEDGESEFTKTMLTTLTSFMLGKLGDNNNVKQSDLDNIRGSDLDYIRDNAPELSEIDMHIEHKCSSCSKDFKQDLPALSPDFLLRTRT